MSAIRPTIFFLVLATAGLGLAACENTIRGAGQDVQETGQAVEEAVEAQ